MRFADEYTIFTFIYLEKSKKENIDYIKQEIENFYDISKNKMNISEIFCSLGKYDLFFSIRTTHLHEISSSLLALLDEISLNCGVFFSLIFSKELVDDRKKDITSIEDENIIYQLVIILNNNDNINELFSKNDSKDYDIRIFWNINVFSPIIILKSKSLQSIFNAKLEIVKKFQINNISLKKSDIFMISYRCLNKLEMEKIENFDFQIFLKAESTLYEKIQQLMKKLFDVYTYEIYFSSGWYDMLLIVHNISFLDIKNKIYELHSIDGKISTNTLILYKEA